MTRVSPEEQAFIRSLYSDEEIATDCMICGEGIDSVRQIVNRGTTIRKRCEENPENE